jgi:hypothetical protein
VKTKRKVAGKDWEFDGTTITVHIPMAWKRHGSRKVIIAPDGSEAWAPAKWRPNDTPIHARAQRWTWRRSDSTYRLPPSGGRKTRSDPCDSAAAADPLLDDGNVTEPRLTRRQFVCSSAGHGRCVLRHGRTRRA